MNSLKKCYKATIFMFLSVILLVPLLLIKGTGKAFAYDEASYHGSDAYTFTIDSYTVDYTISSDRTMDVVELTEITYTGYESTGHVHLIPVNAGDRVRSLRVYEIIGGVESSVDYTVSDDYDGYIAANIGDYENKTNETHTYKLTYSYAITKPTNENAIYLNPIGFGWDCEILSADITLRLPDGYINDSSCYYVGNGSAANTPNYSDGVITLHTENLAKEEGVTFDLYFEDGALTTKQDFTPYWIVIAACICFAALAAIKFLCFNGDRLAPVTNVTAPDDMDPLIMGKLIDNSIEESDVTSLIYYWANKGYLKIDISDENDIKLIRIMRYLPNEAPSHQKKMYNDLFRDGHGRNGDMVSVNSLKYRFYNTVNAVKKQVNAESGKLYTGKSMAVAVIFALIGAAIMGLSPLILGMVTISPKFTDILPVIVVIPIFVVFALAQTAKFHKYKRKKAIVILSFVGIILLAAVFSVIYVLAVPSYIIEIAPKILLCIAGFGLATLSVSLISRTPAYTEKLNEIMGFKDFISSVEKEKLEMMIDENPELYYKILPYAQVLGVTDVWEEKFKGLTVEPPRWAVGYGRMDVFDVIIFTSFMRHINANMLMSMTSRPHSSPSPHGLSGGGGTHFGGGGGFGHGGGGGFGR